MSQYLQQTDYLTDKRLAAIVKKGMLWYEKN